MKHYVLTALLASVQAGADTAAAGPGDRGRDPRINAGPFEKYSKCQPAPYTPSVYEKFDGYDFTQCARSCDEYSRRTGEELCCTIDQGGDDFQCKGTVKVNMMPGKDDEWSYMSRPNTAVAVAVATAAGPGGPDGPGDRGRDPRINSGPFEQYSQCKKGPMPPIVRDKFEGYDFTQCARRCDEESRRIGQELCCSIDQGGDDFRCEGYEKTNKMPGKDDEWSYMARPGGPSGPRAARRAGPDGPDGPGGPGGPRKRAQIGNYADFKNGSKCGRTERQDIPKDLGTVETERRFESVNGAPLDLTGCQEACHDWQDQLPDQDICCRAEIRGGPNQRYECKMSLNDEIREGDKDEDLTYIPKKGKRPARKGGKGGKGGKGDKNEMRIGDNNMGVNFWTASAMTLVSTMSAAVTVFTAQF